MLIDTVIGKSVAHYEITELIGEGGMGQVFRATDTKLRRDVALKILPESFAQDPQRMARFQREAEVLASLNHPNIAGIHGLEREGETHAIAMELVEGETLAARISRGAIPLEEALKIALQIAEALEAAHEKGIIHRDLKPANLIVTPEGTVKVLDFGLAKAVDPEPNSQTELAQSPTLTMQATQAGIILGTAAYMSPEQAKGKPVDKRADNWAFGVVLFEMLTGVGAFAGNDITEVLAAVVMKDPDWQQLPADLPAAVRRVLERCLCRDTRSRLRDIGDARISIEGYLANPEADSPILHPSDQTAFWTQPTVWMMVGLAVILAVLATWFLKPMPDIPEPPLIRTIISAEELNMGRGYRHAISPDGKILVYSVDNRLWIRYLDRFYPDPLPDSQGAGYPFFSPDSQFLAYRQGDTLWKVHLASNTKSPVCDLPGYAGGTWGTDGFIVFGSFGGEGDGKLYRVSDQGGDPQPILERDRDKGEGSLTFPHFLPDQRGVLFSTLPPGQGTVNLLVDDKRTTLLSREDAGFSTPVYSPSGHLVYRRSGSNDGLYAVPFSLSSLEISGEPFRIAAEGVWPTVSLDQRLSYKVGSSGFQHELVRVYRTGQAVATIGQPQEWMHELALSPDGNRVAVAAREDGTEAIWVHDVQRGSKRRLSFLEAGGRYPAWTASGDQVAFFTRPGGFEIWIRPTDGSSAAQKLTDGRRPYFSADGRFLVFDRRLEETGDDLWVLEVGQEGDPKPFLVTEHNESRARLSPDGRWVAYISDDSGETQVYVKKFPSGEGLWHISTGQGRAPFWSPDGDELFYLQGRDLMVVAVKVTDDSALEHGTPTKLFTHPNPNRYYAVGKGGDSFILSQPVRGEATPPAIAIVHNWVSEFRDRQ